MPKVSITRMWHLDRKTKVFSLYPQFRFVFFVFFILFIFLVWWCTDQLISSHVPFQQTKLCASCKYDYTHHISGKLSINFSIKDNNLCGFDFSPCNTRGDVLLIVQTALSFFHKMKVNDNQGLKGSKMTSTTAVDNLTCNAQVKWTCGAFHFQVFWDHVIALFEEHNSIQCNSSH